MIKYHYEKSSWEFDDYGREHRKTVSETREAQLIYTKPVHYCDGEKMYFAAECSESEAKRVCEEINAAREHQFSDYAEYVMVPNGALIRVIHPYND